MGLLMTVKGLPLAYNRDLQEDKEPLFDTVDTVKAAVRLMAGLLEELTVRPEKMAAALHGGFLTATDMADYLVTKGLPFRTAHEQVGQTVAYAENPGPRAVGTEPGRNPEICPPGPDLTCSTG